MSMADDLEGGATTRREFFTQARRAKQSSRSQQRRHAPERQASLRTDAEFKKVLYEGCCRRPSARGANAKCKPREVLG